MRIAVFVAFLASSVLAQDTDANQEPYGPPLPDELEDLAAPVDLEPVDIEEHADELEEPCTGDTGVSCAVDKAADRLEALRKHFEAEAAAQELEEHEEAHQEAEPATESLDR